MRVSPVGRSHLVRDTRVQLAPSVLYDAPRDPAQPLRQTDRQTDTHTHRHTDRHKHKVTGNRQTVDAALVRRVLVSGLIKRAFGMNRYRS